MISEQIPSSGAVPSDGPPQIAGREQLLRAPRQTRSFAARTHASLEAVEPIWRRFESDGNCTVYQSYEWAHRVVRHLAAGSGAVPLVVEVFDAQSRLPLMLLPFMVRKAYGCRIVEWLDCDVCDYAAPLLALGFVPTLAEIVALWAVVCRSLQPADFLRIQRIPPTLGAVANPLALLPAVTPAPTRSHGLPIDGPPDSLLKRVCRPSLAKELGKNARRLERQGRLRFVEADSRVDVESLFSALIEQRRTRFQQVGRFDLLADPRVQAFYLDAALGSLGGHGPVRLFGVSLDGEWIACQYTLVDRDRLHALVLTMDEEWRKYSPGMHVVGEVMIWARRKGLSYFDLTIGDLPYKAAFGARENQLSELRQPLSARGAVVLAGLAAAWAGKSVLRRQRHLYDTLRSGRQALRRLQVRMAAVRSRGEA